MSLVQSNRILCEIGPSIGSVHSSGVISVHLGDDVVSSRSFSFSSLSFKLPSVSHVVGQGGHTTGGDTITVYGSNFGVSGGSVYVNGTECTVTSDSFSPNYTAIACTLAQGQGTGLNLTVSVFGRVSEPFLYSYGRPHLNKVSPSVQPTSGGSVLSLEGFNFGTKAGAVYINDEVCELSVVNNDVVWFESRILCVAPGGEGTPSIRIVPWASDESFWDLIDEESLESSHELNIPEEDMESILFKYESPVVLNVTGCSPSGCSREGGDTLTIIGTNFGSSGGSVMVGKWPCLDVQHSIETPHTKLHCTTQGGHTRMNEVVYTQARGEVATGYVVVEYAACPKSTYFNRLEQESDTDFACRECPNGTFSDPAPFVTATFCEPCQSGTAGTFGECLLCEVGTAQPSRGATSCEACEVGKYSEGVGQDVCELCRPGTKGVMNTIAECEACPTGKYQSGEGETRCLLCAPGKYAPFNESRECTPCPDDTVATKEGSDKCSPCPNNGVSYDGETCACAIGFYWPTSSNKEGTLTCVACPEGAECTRENVREDEVTAAKGYWKSKKNNTLEFYSCPIRTNCIGGESTCEGNHVGPLCQLCDDGYYRTAGDSCEGGFGLISFRMASLFVCIFFCVCLFPCLFVCLFVCVCVCVCVCVFPF